MKKSPEIIAKYTHMFKHSKDDFLHETYEHIQDSSNESRIYFHLCENCRLRFDTDKEKQLCPRCKRPSKNIGFEIREFEATTFWEKLKNKIDDFLP